jgi:hypothetical protein
MCSCCKACAYNGGPGRGWDIDREAGLARGVCVCRLTCASILIRCLRTSSSLSLNEYARAMNASGDGGSQLGEGWMRTSKSESWLIDSSTRWRQQYSKAKPTRNRKGIPEGLVRRVTATAERTAYLRRGKGPKPCSGNRVEARLRTKSRTCVTAN